LTLKAKLKSDTEELASHRTILDSSGKMRRPSAWFQETQEERKEQQLGLLGFDHLQQVLGRVLVVERAREWGIGEDKGVFLGLPGMVLERGCRGK
jgi:hypothetical protein